MRYLTSFKTLEFPRVVNLLENIQSRAAFLPIFHSEIDPVTQPLLKYTCTIHNQVKINSSYILSFLRTPYHPHHLMVFPAPTDLKESRSMSTVVRQESATSITVMFR